MSAISHRFILMLAALVFAVLSNACSAEQASRTVSIVDDRVVILKGGGGVALLKISNQRISPEVMDYRCLWRDDGKFSFETNDKAVSAESMIGAKNLKFGPFLIGWSAEGSGGKGWLYLDKFPGGKSTPHGVSCVVTKHSEFSQVTQEEIDVIK